MRVSMKPACLIALVCLVQLVGVLLVQAVQFESYSREWMQFKSKYGKNYESQAEEARRFANFMATKHQVELHNAQENKSFEMGLNHFADWTGAELAGMNGLKVDDSDMARIEAQENKTESEAYLASILARSSDPVPDELDWTKVAGRVSPVKDQGQCGSCWAFSTVGALEGQVVEHAFNKTGKFVSLSEQELVDCSHSNRGCFGGLMSAAFNDLKKIGGIMSEDDYPYKARHRKCAFTKDKAVMGVAGRTLLPKRDETKLKETLAKFGPISIGIHANSMLIHYKSGILIDKTCSSGRIGINHGVLLVGYGTDPEHGNYWIIKNSWDADWGEVGHFRMKRGVNMCGV